MVDKILQDIIKKVPKSFRFGNREREPDSKFRLSVVTGDKIGAGTYANIYIIVSDSEGRSTDVIHLNHCIVYEHKRGSIVHFDFDTSSGVAPPFTQIKIWRDKFGGISLPFGFIRDKFGGRSNDVSEWLLDRVEIAAVDDNITIGECPTSLDTNASNYTITNESSSSKDQLQVWVFPVHRWIDAHIRYIIPLHDSVLPQNDDREVFRREELEKKKKSYVYAENVIGGPIQVKDLPQDEKVSENFYWSLELKQWKLLIESQIKLLISKDWKTPDDLVDIFKFSLQPPIAVNHWKDDKWFSLQRVQGADSTVIQFCENIPESIDVSSVTPELLEGKTLQQAADEKRIFICNLSILKGLVFENNRKVAAPIALFYLNSNDELLPILIQLQQERSPDNPVYTPLDSPNTWLVAKMYYNNAEAQYHQSATHLGLTHMLMENVCAACHRNLSPSHPIFKLLAPHFLYIIAINKEAEAKLINKGGWVDNTMTQGSDGMFKIMAKHRKNWKFLNTDIQVSLKERGVLDPTILPYYPYRDDGIKLYEIIRKYVEKIVSRYYDSVDALTEDWELKNFRYELSAPFPNGIDINELPGSDEGFSSVEEVVDTITGIISTCSLGHAAANAQQYEQYAFTPNYPAILTKDPPTKKIVYTDEDILALIPSKEIIAETVVITNLLASPITKHLGDFEVQYLYHPEDLQALDTFREELKSLSNEIALINEYREHKYTALDPHRVPNSISI